MRVFKMRRMGINKVLSLVAGAIAALALLVPSRAGSTPQPASTEPPIEKFSADFPLSEKKVSHTYFDRILAVSVTQDERSGISLVFYEAMGEQVRAVL